MNPTKGVAQLHAAPIWLVVSYKRNGKHLSCSAYSDRKKICTQADNGTEN